MMTVLEDANGIDWPDVIPIDLRTAEPWKAEAGAVQLAEVVTELDAIQPMIRDKGRLDNPSRQMILLRSRGSADVQKSIETVTVSLLQRASSGEEVQRQLELFPECFTRETDGGFTLQVSQFARMKRRRGDIVSLFHIYTLIAVGGERVVWSVKPLTVSSGRVSRRGRR